MTSKNIRADALTNDQRIDLEKAMAWCPYGSSAANTIRELLAASPVDRPAAAPIGVVPAYGVFRTHPDENDGEEFFYHANWHNDYIAQEGERIVEGWFVTAPAPVDERAAFDNEVGKVIADAATRGIAWMAFKAGADYARAALANKEK